MSLPDVQAARDGRNVAIPAVGISPVTLPLTFWDEAAGRGPVPIDASVALFTDLTAQDKGIHMSRLVQILMDTAEQPVTAAQLLQWVGEARTRLGANSGFTGVSFRYHLVKAAPVTGGAGYVPYMVRLLAGTVGDQTELGWQVAVPVTTLCPCSKAIADYGAHNQRGLITVAVQFSDASRFPALAAFVTELEGLGSAPMYALLKRPDEKWVTERAYEHPKFVEDVLRDTVLLLQSRTDIAWFAVTVSNDESIHTHNAVACYDRSLASADCVRPRIALWNEML